MTEAQAPLYACGHSARELERLRYQGAFFEETTHFFLQRAGIARGMRVLDIGCGAGDVTFLAADMVGTSGYVLGIDRAPEAIRTATAHAASRGLKQVDFRATTIEDLAPSVPMDALIGRFVLMHQADPVRTLHAAAGHVRQGGIVAVLESHMSASVAGVHSCPHSATYDRVTRWIRETIRVAGAHPDMGLRLRQVFVDAGLPAPELWLQAVVEGGPDAAIYLYITESLRSMLPLAERFGITSLSTGEIDELERQLRGEVTASGGVLTSPLVVGAWCRLP